MTTFRQPPQPRLKRPAVITLGFVAVMVLSGCLRIEADLTLNPDDTVSGSYVYAVSIVRAEELGFTGEGLAAQLGAGDVIDTYSTTVVAPYSDGSLEGLAIEFTDEPMATFDGALPDGIAIRREGDEYFFDAPTLRDASDADAETLADSEITLSVTFPGAISEHNGTLNRTTVSWNLRSATEAPHARGQASAKTFPWTATGIAGVVGLASLASLWVMKRRRASG